MTIESTLNQSGPYTGNNTLDTYSYNFRITESNQLRVFETDLNAGVTELTLNTDYTVTGVGDTLGGTVVRSAGNLPTGYIWFILGTSDLLQKTNFKTQGRFFPTTHQDALDKIGRSILTLNSLLANTLKLNENQDNSVVSTTLPSPVADRLIGWNATATALTNLASAGTLATTPYGESLLAAATAAAARTILGMDNYVNNKQNFTATTDPTVNDDSDDGYGVGSPWVNTSSGDVFICGDATVGAAVWIQINASPTERYTGGNKIAPHESLEVKTNSTNPAYQVDIDVDAILLKTTGGAYHRATSVNLTADITASGVNGLDTGSEAADTWYYIWVIYNGTTVASLISTSSTSPTMPSGYTYKGLVGAVRNNGSSNFLSFFQYGKEAYLETAAYDRTGALTVAAGATPTTLTVPPNTWARFLAFNASSAGSYLLVTATNQTDTAPTSIFSDLASSTNYNEASEMVRRVDSSSQIRLRVGVVNSTATTIKTQGWRWE